MGDGFCCDKKFQEQFAKVNRLYYSRNYINMSGEKKYNNL